MIDHPKRVHGGSTIPATPPSDGPPQFYDGIESTVWNGEQTDIGHLSSGPPKAKIRDSYTDIPGDGITPG